MILTGLVAGIVTATLVLGGLILILVTTKNRITEVIRDFISPAGENEPSPLAKTVDLAAQMLATRLTVQLKSTFMGIESGEARKAAAAAAEDNPAAGLLSIFGGKYPGSSKRLAKNPLVAKLLENVADKLLAGSSPGGNHHQGSPGQNKLEY